MPRITKSAVARALRNGDLTHDDLLDVLNGWTPPQSRKRRPRIPYLKKAGRDFLIIATFEHLTKNGTAREAAKVFTAEKCGVSRSEVTRILADQKKDIGELLPDDLPPT